MTHLPLTAVLLLAVTISTSYIDTSDVFDKSEMEVGPDVSRTNDIMPKHRRPHLRNSPRSAKRWPGGLVPYEISTKYESDFKSRLLEAMRTLEGNVKSGEGYCVRFQPRTKSAKDWMAIEPDNGCSSPIGMTKGKHIVYLVKDGCGEIGAIMHELLHTLGFEHEQSRPDRDTFLQINWSNIQSDMRHNFHKYSSSEVDTYGLPYDYGSIMHYDAYSFAKNGESPTIVPKGGSIDKHTLMGQRDRMTAIDVKKVQKRYSCPANTSHIANPDANNLVFSCDFESKCPDLVHKRYPVKWEILQGNTPGPTSGPDADHTNALGHYAFVGANGNHNKFAILRSPKNIKAGKYCLHFWVFMDGGQGGELNAFTEIRGRYNGFVYYSEVGSTWTEQKMTIDTTKPWKLVFRYKVGTGDSSEVALDDVKLMANGVCDE